MNIDKLSLFTDLIKKSTIKKLSVNITGNSMHPTIKNGDSVFVNIYHGEALKCGDIIVYRKFKKHLTIHRIVKITKDICGNNMYITKGDNAMCCDSYYVYKDEIMAKVPFKCICRDL